MARVNERISKYALLFIKFYFHKNLPLLLFIFVKYLLLMPTPVAAQSKAWVYGRSLAGIVNSNPAEGMDVCLL
jgi:hypothetical protein